MTDITHRYNLTAREQAALSLRVPDSGSSWLDEMIVKARRLDIAAQVIAAQQSGSRAEDPLDLADALLGHALAVGTLVAEPPEAPEPVQVSAPTPVVTPTFTLDGVAYKEAHGPEEGELCEGCAFSRVACGRAVDAAKEVFGGACGSRDVIYVRA